MQVAHIGVFLVGTDFPLGAMKQEEVERHQREEKNVKGVQGGGHMHKAEWVAAGCYDVADFARQLLAMFVRLKVRHLNPILLGSWMD